MEACAFLTARSGLRLLRLRSCGWGHVAALSLCATLSIWSDRAAAQVSASAQNRSANGQPSYAGDSGSTKIDLGVLSRGTRIDLGSLVSQQSDLNEQMPATGITAHPYLPRNQDEIQPTRRGGAGGTSGESAGQVAQTRRRSPDSEWTDADYSDGDTQERPAQLTQVQRPQMGNIGQMTIKH